MDEQNGSKNPEPWRAQFDAQATRSLLDKVHRATRARLQVYAGRTQHVNAADVDDMMMGVITDTLDGTLSWNYERQPLETHLLDTVRYRVRDDARRRWRDNAKCDVLDEDTTDVSSGESMLAGAALERADEAHVIRRTAEALVAAVRQRIVGDVDLVKLFDAIVVHGALERVDIMKETGMSARTYRNVRRRLDRTLLELPAHTRDAVMAAFVN
ncbi:MAG: hypothetical protein NT062_36365 [Proteobacteria bacterium]|nr:hypothetical protein [Pseudomonadota bacterium]